MRVIAGSARSVPLVAPPGKNTRPTTDRIKETLFNIIQGEIEGVTFIDLFAGSGAIGIEALSRGVNKGVFVEKDTATMEIIKANAAKCRLSEKAVFIKNDALNISSYRKYLQGEEKKVIFLDPPYMMGLGEKVIRALNNEGLIADDTLIILEEAIDYDLRALSEAGVNIEKIKEYKNQKHIFCSKIKES